MKMVKLAIWMVLIGSLTLIGSVSSSAADDTNNVAAADDWSGSRQALGCVATAGVGLTATALAGATEVMLLWGGGLLIQSQASALWLVLLAQIGVSGCALGATATPTVLWTVDQWDNITARTAQIVRHTGQQIAAEFAAIWAATGGQLSAASP